MKMECQLMVELTQGIGRNEVRVTLSRMKNGETSLEWRYSMIVLIYKEE